MSETRPTDAGTERPQKTPRRRRWYWAGGLVVVGALVWFAPAIVAHTGLRQQIAPLVAPKFRGQVQVGSASVGWLSPIVLRDVRITDAQGEPLADVPAMTSRKSLLAILADRRHPGHFRFERPRLLVILRDGGSNVEDALAGLFFDTEDGPPDTASPAVAFSLEVADGRVEVAQPATGRRWTLSAVALSIDKPQNPDEPITADLTATVASPKQTGRLETRLSWHPPPATDPASWGAGRLNAKSSGLPLEMLQPALGRMFPQWQVAGLVNADLQCEWKGGASPSTVTASGKLDASRLAVAAPDLLGSDVLRADFVKLAGGVAFDGRWVRADRFRIDSDLGNVNVTGAVRLDEMIGPQSRRLLPAGGLSDDFRLDGRIDLAQLARVLPGAMRIRSGTQIIAGDVRVEFSSRIQPRAGADAPRRWRGRIAAANLSAMRAGRPIVWEQPISVSFSARESDDGPVVEQLLCRSDFLELSAGGTRRRATLSAHADLSRLAAELEQFVDLGKLTFAGRMTAAFDWRRNDDGRLETGGDLVVEDFALVAPGVRPWREKRLTAGISVRGVADNTGATRIDHASMSLRSGDDRLGLALQRPVTDVSTKSAWPLDVEIQGRLATWLARVGPWLPLDGWDADGAVDFRGAVLVRPGRFQIETQKADIRQLDAHGHGWRVNEPLVRIATSAVWDAARGRLTSKVTTLTSSTVAFRADDLVLQWLDGGAMPITSGKIDFRCDLARLGQLRRDARAEPVYYVAGMAVGGVELAHRSGITEAAWTADIASPAIFRRVEPKMETGSDGNRLTGLSRPSWQPIWRESQLRLSGRGSYEAAADTLRLRELNVTSSAAQLSTSGRIEQLATRRKADLAGRVAYDLNSVVEWFRGYLGPGVEVAGRGTRDFSIRGPLSASAITSSGEATVPGQPATSAGQAATAKPARWPDRELVVRAGLGWSSADIYGLNVGPGRLDAQLARGVIDFSPLELAVSEGRLTAAPRIKLSTTPAAMVLGRGRLVENVRFSPQMCQSWLGYVAPLLARATQIDGRFSIDLSGADVPLLRPNEGAAAGVLAIHEAEVRPGPLAQQILAVAAQVEAVLTRRATPRALLGGSGALLKITRQDVPFQMIDGRVHHGRLEMTAAGVTVRTSGSVGLDQSLALVAEVPVRDRWVERDRLLASLRGQVVRVPIRGTLGKPSIDRRALEELARRLATDAAGRLLEDELKKQLKHLFGPLPGS